MRIIMQDNGIAIDRSAGDYGGNEDINCHFDDLAFLLCSKIHLKPAL